MKLSIIVPVYNVERFVGPCLDSLLHQGIDTTEYEIICVDDGSKDSSGAILDEYARNHSNIVVVHKENAGVSSARNEGLRRARGKYVYFCDSDDILHCILGDVLRLIEKNGADSCSFRYRQVEEDFCLKDNALSEELTYRMGSKAAFYSGNIYLFIFLRELIVENDIRFNTRMQYGEDELFLWNVCLYLDFSKHIYVDNVAYLYRQRQGSLLHEEKHRKHRMHYTCMKAMANEYKSIMLRENLSKPLYKETRHRYSYAITNALYDGLFLEGVNGAEVLSDLKEGELYPFPFYRRLLKPHNSWKTTLVNWVKFFFPFRFYYLLWFRLAKR